MKKKLPAFKTDEEAARFLDRKDLSDYINAENMVPARFEFERKTKNLTMRIPASLLEAVKARAARQGIRRAELADGATSMTAANDLAIRRALEAAGVEFIDQNGGGAGVRLKRPS